MTKMTDETIARLKEDLTGKTISDVYHEKEGDYFVIEFEGSGEISLRFMMDLIN